MSFLVASLKQRGFLGMSHLVMVVAILGLLTAAALMFNAWIRSIEQRGYDRGAAAVHAEAHKRAEFVSAALRQSEINLVAAEARALVADTDWKGSLRESKRTRAALGSCPSTPAADGAGLRAPTATVPADSDRGPRLHWRYVGMHDGAFTGLDGKPLFAASSGYALEASRADTASPYGLDDALDVAGENARALSACVRSFEHAMTLIDQAERAFGTPQ